MAKKTTTKKTPPRTTNTRKATKRKTTPRKATTKKPAAKKTTSAKKPAAKKTTSAKKPAAKKTRAKKAASPRRTQAKKTSSRTKARGACTKKKCTKKKCSARKPGLSLIGRARDCQNLEECRQFIIELTDAAEQANAWLNDMHAQALSAEQTRDLYAGQISDLVEAIDLDRARIAELEADLKKARGRTTRSAASDAVLRKLSELGREVKKIRTDLERLAAGHEPAKGRRRQVKKAKTASTTRSRNHRPTTPTDRRGEASVGPFAKYSVLRGAACSLGVGKHGYPPEVCAPAYFDRSEAAEILGTYAQNDYGGLAKWALITGFPIDDGGRPVVPTVAQPASKLKAAKSTARKKKAASKKSSSKKKARKSATSVESTTRTTKRRSTKVTASGRSSQQILDQVLLTVARI